MRLLSFATWEQVLAYVDAGGMTYYQAPLDRRAVLVRVKRRGKGIRVMPPTCDADPFTADPRHLDTWTLPDFDRANREDPDRETMSRAIDALAIGESVSFGGGAIAVTRVTRVT